MTTAIRVAMLGTDTPHQLGFAIDRPAGLGDWLLLRFRTPMELRTADGPGSAEPGDCILFSPGFRQWYRGRGVGFRDDWLHFHGSGSGPLVRRLGIPVNRVLRPRRTTFVPRLLAEIAVERSRREPHWEEAVAHLLSSLLIALARQLDSAAGRTGERAERLRELRRGMLGELARPWTIAGLARRAGLRPSRFQQLYRELFGAPPIEDLISARIEHARMLLSTAGSPVAEVAADCGFGSVFHFSRTFRRRVGCAPRDYHRQAGGTARAPASPR